MGGRTSMQRAPVLGSIVLLLPLLAGCPYRVPQIQPDPPVPDATLQARALAVLERMFGHESRCIAF